MSARPASDTQEAIGAAAGRAAYRVEEVAEQLGVGRSAVYNLIASGELASFRVGRSRRVPAGAVNDFIRRQLAS